MSEPNTENGISTNPESVISKDEEVGIEIEGVDNLKNSTPRNQSFDFGSLELEAEPSGQDLLKADKSLIMEYRVMSPIRTWCYVVFVKNCFNLDIDYQLTEEQRSRYSGCIQNSYRYSEMDKTTFELENPKVGIAYRSRLKGISFNGKKGKKNCQFFQTAMTKATIEVTNAVLLTSGFFHCELGDIDIFNRILVTLFDPVTNLSLNSLILQNYPSIFSEYGAERIETSLEDQYGSRESRYRRDNRRNNRNFRTQRFN